MKKLLVIAAALALFATPALALIEGSKHDLATGTEGACSYCHVPHNAPAGAALTPLVSIGTAGDISSVCVYCHSNAVTVPTAAFQIAQLTNDIAGKTDHPVTGTTVASATFIGGVTLSCASCHEVHAGGNFLLDNTNSTVCTACHIR